MDALFYQTIPAPSVEISDSLPITSGPTVDPTHLEPSPDGPALFSHPPSGWTAQSTRVYDRPCRCGKSTCRWRFFYLDRMIFATHEVLDSLEAGEIPPLTPAAQNTSAPPKLSIRQKETFFLSSLEGPKFTFHKTFAVPVLRKDCSDGGLLRFLEREPWANLRPDKVVCLGCGCDVSIQNPTNWICHRDLCVGIDNAILRSVVDAWESEVAELSLIEN